MRVLVEHGQLPLAALWRLRVVVGEDLQGLGVLAHEAPADAANALAHLVSLEDPRLCALEFLDEDPRYPVRSRELPVRAAIVSCSS